jgi:hypothetical protein
MTVQIPILNQSFAPDVGVYVSPLTSQMALTNVKRQLCVVMPFPTGADLGFELEFTLPQNYASAPVLVIKGVLDGTPANVLAFGVTQIARADSESIDTAYEAEDVANNSTWTGYADEDMYEETITITPTASYVAGKTVFLKFFRDDSVDTTTFDFLLTDLRFQYTES